MKNLIRIVVIMALISVAEISSADKGNVPPPFSPVNMKNIVTVSEFNGDYTDPITAVQEIIDASATNPYLVVIGPGIYYISGQLVMKPYVSVKGSGRDATTIIGDGSGSSLDASSALLIGASNATLSDLTLINEGTNFISIAIYNDQPVTIERVLVIARNSNGNATGVLNRGPASPILRDVAVQVSDSDFGTPYGSWGIRNDGNSAPTIENVEVTASGALYSNTGLSIDGYSSPFIVDSKLEGERNALLLGDTASGQIVNNMIVGGILRSGSYTGGTVCRGNYDENLNDVNCEVTP